MNLDKEVERLLESIVLEEFYGDDESKLDQLFQLGALVAVGTALAQGTLYLTDEEVAEFMARVKQ